MVSKTVTVADPIGLHARPAGQIVKAVKESGFEVYLNRIGNDPVKANSPLRLMSQKIKTGEQLEITISAEGDQAEALADLIESYLQG